MLRTVRNLTRSQNNLPMKPCPSSKKTPRKLKLFMWVALAGLLVSFAALGQHYQQAEAQATSSTRTVTVNATVSPDIEIYIADTTITLSVTSPGSAVTDENNIEVWTNSETGYKLFQSHNNNLTHTDTSTIIDPDAGIGSVDAPEPYADNGLAFSMNGTPVEGVWDAGSNFSTFYDSATEANCYASYSAGNTVINVIYQLDVATTQKSGSYSNEVYWYAVSNDGL